MINLMVLLTLAVLCLAASEVGSWPWATNHSEAAATHHQLNPHCFASEDMIARLSGRKLNVQHLAWISSVLSSLASSHKLRLNLLVIGMSQETEMWLALSQACGFRLIFLESNRGRHRNITSSNPQVKDAYHFKFFQQTVSLHSINSSKAVDETKIPLAMYLHFVYLDVLPRSLCYSVTFVHASDRIKEPLVETAAFALALASKCNKDRKISSAYVFVQSDELGQRGGIRIIEQIVKRERLFKKIAEIDSVVLFA